MSKLLYKECREVKRCSISGEQITQLAGVQRADSSYQAALIDVCHGAASTPVPPLLAYPHRSIRADRQYQSTRF